MTARYSDGGFGDEQLVNEHNASTVGAGGRRTTPMLPRSSDEQHRAATPLELFFDLVFVVAIAQAAGSLHHGLASAHVATPC